MEWVKDMRKKTQRKFPFHFSNRSFSTFSTESSVRGAIMVFSKMKKGGETLFFKKLPTSLFIKKGGGGGAGVSA